MLPENNYNALLKNAKARFAFEKAASGFSLVRPALGAGRTFIARPAARSAYSFINNAANASRAAAQDASPVVSAFRHAANAGRAAASTPNAGQAASPVVSAFRHAANAAPKVPNFQNAGWAELGGRATGLPNTLSRLVGRVSPAGSSATNYLPTVAGLGLGLGGGALGMGLGALGTGVASNLASKAVGGAGIEGNPLSELTSYLFKSPQNKAYDPANFYLKWRRAGLTGNPLSYASLAAGNPIQTFQMLTGNGVPFNPDDLTQYGTSQSTGVHGRNNRGGLVTSSNFVPNADLRALMESGLKEFDLGRTRAYNPYDTRSQRFRNADL